MMRRVTQKSRYRPNTNTENQKRTDLQAKSKPLQLVLSPSFHGTSEMETKRWGRIGGAMPRVRSVLFLALKIPSTKMCRK